jgi:hypothetical protein
MTTDRPADDGAPDPEIVSIDERRHPGQRDRDGVSSLHDVESEQGDEDGLEDAFEADDRALREAGANLEGRDEPEPGLT